MISARRFAVQDKISPGEAGIFLHAEAIMKEHNAVSRIADGVTAEEPKAQAISFVVRIWKQIGLADPECRGWVEHVQSGQRTLFLGLDQLLSIIAAYVGIPIRRGGWWRNRLRRWRARLAEYFVRGEEIEGGERPESNGRG
jgi:hypothetical protein